MSMRTRGIGICVTVGAALALAALSELPLRATPTPEAMLRVAFSARPERVESCRTLDAEELAGVPQHMRQTVVCEGTTARYRLDVLHADTIIATAQVRGGGLRHDRQLYVLREVRIPAGESTIEVRLSRIDSVGERATIAPGAGDGDRVTAGVDSARPDADARSRRMADEVPPLLVLRETVRLRPREVLLVTYDQSLRRLRTVRGDSTPTGSS